MTAALVGIFCRLRPCALMLLLLPLQLLSVPFMPIAQAQSEFAAGLRFVEDVVVAGLPVSTTVAFAPNNRLFLALKVGIVRVVENGQLLQTPFLDISSVVNKATDRGLLGLAVDPDFPTRPYVYLSYVYDPPGMTPDSSAPRVTRIVRYTADAAQNFNVALPGSEEVLVGKQSIAENIPEPVPVGDPNIPERASCMTGLTMEGRALEDCIACDSLSHTAGTLIFGPQRQLYASLGDGADYNGPTRIGFRAQDPDSLSGRVIRIDPDSGDGLPGNPYFDSSLPRANRSRLWSLGLRNPFRITINPANGQVYMGDVGTSYYEEINAGKGANFGWPCYEGGFSQRAVLEGIPDTSMQQVGYRVHPRTVGFCNGMYAGGQGLVSKAVYTYRHPYDETGKDLGASVTGLAFYSGTGYPSSFYGALFYADYAQRFIKYLTFDAEGTPTPHLFAKETGSNLGAVQLISGPDSNIYAVYIDLKTRTSQVRRFRAVGVANSSPVIRAEVSPLYGNLPLEVAFAADRSYDLDGQELRYSWDFGDGTPPVEGATVKHTYTTVGAFTVRLNVTETTAPFDSSGATYTIKTGVLPPLVTIDEPSENATYRIGTPVRFSGGLVDPSSVAADIQWSILQKHNLHEHLVAEVQSVRGSFMPTEHSDNTSYELCLSARTNEGLQDQKCRNLLPETANYTLASSPPGAQITYVDDEIDIVAPHVIKPIVGSEQTIAAAALHRGRTFSRWSDGVRTQARSFKTESTARRFVALYRNLRPQALITARVSRGSGSAIVTLSATGSKDPEGERLTYSWVTSDGYRSRMNRITRRVPLGKRIGVRVLVRDNLGGTATKSVSLSVSRLGAVAVRGAVRRG